MQKDLGKKLRLLRVDGGAATNNFLMQLQANYLGKTIIRPNMIETTAAGAAYLAGIAIGFWNKDQLSEHKNQHEFNSEMNDAYRKELLSKWDKAISRTIHWEN